jgi:hypothetical protein
MRTAKNILLIAIALVMLAASTVFAEKAGNRGKLVSRGEDGGVCYELDVKDAIEWLEKMEETEKAGKLKEAFDAATAKYTLSAPACMPENGWDRMDDIIARTYKPLGQQAEKAGRLYEAHKYYIYPYDRFFRPNLSYWDRMKQSYSLADAHRTMLAHAKANRDDHKIVQEAKYYFLSFDDKPPQLKEVYDLAMQGGDKLLAKEEKDFAARRYKDALEDLNESGRWFGLADDEQRVNVRAKMRFDSLFADDSYDSIERAGNYCDISLMGDDYSSKSDAVRVKAGKLGDQAQRKGDYALAGRFYSLAGENEKQDAMSRLIEENEEQKERQHEENESRRQDQFQKDQKALEKELGL